MNDFEIISKIGEGAYSLVYKVRRLIDENIYALKKVKLINLSEKERKNALNEVRLLASVKSNFVISYKEAFFDEKDNTLCMIMEYADGGDLYEKIKENRKSQILFEESDIWRIFIQLVKGLKALHELNILHRDLKSANVFLMKDGSVKLGDLNVSKVYRQNMGYTQTGTPYYASPEVWNDKPYDTKSDIWSMGCVLYEMASLKPPFRAKNMEGLYKKVMEGKVIRIPTKFTNDLFRIIQILLQVKPEKRPTCGEILQNPIILRRIEFFKNYSGDDVSEDQALLKTIIFPKNLLVLPEKLPKPNYGSKSYNKKINFYTSINNNSNINNNIETTISVNKKNVESFENDKNKEKDINNNNDINKEQISKNMKNVNNKNLSSNIDNEKNNNLKNSITKSISKRELPAIKNQLLKKERISDNSKININNIHPYVFNSDFNVRKKNNNIFNILSKKNLMHKNEVNNIGRYNNYNVYINSNIFNINRINNIRKKNNYADIQKENAKNKIPSKIKLNPIKKSLLNVL